jgi:NADPH-dependent 2,4-dienoyl-CoA reductase/sulfur reductase-like enzyme
MVADSAARGIRELDPHGEIGILAQEDTPPAARPPLSKNLWTDPDFAFDDIWLNTEADTGAVRHAGISAVSIDRGRRLVATDGDATFGYQELLLATGGAPRRLDLPDDPRILTYRTVADYERLRELTRTRQHVAVIGGGFIASEVAAALVQNGTEVSLIFRGSTLGGKVYPSAIAERVNKVFVDKGVHLHSGAEVVSGDVGPDGIVLHLSTGADVDCDAVVEGIGVTPNVSLAAAAKLHTDDGVVVDEFLRSDDPSIYAAGDVASYPDRLLGRTRVEHEDNANEMGRQAGRNMAGAAEPYTHTPFFYSDLFDDGYEAVGVLDASLETVTQQDGDQSVVYYVEGDRVVGVLLWNTFGHVDDALDAIAHADASNPAARRRRSRTSEV